MKSRRLRQLEGASPFTRSERGSSLFPGLLSFTGLFFKQLKSQVSVRHSIAGVAAVSQAAEQGAGEDGNGVDFATGQEQKHPAASDKRQGVQA